MDNKLEEILFYEALKRQQGTFDLQPKINKVFNELDEKTMKRYVELQSELHDIWNYINGPIVRGAKEKEVHSLLDFHENVAPVSPELVELSTLAGVTLRHEYSQEFKAAYKKYFGKDFEL